MNIVVASTPADWRAGWRATAGPKRRTEPGQAMIDLAKATGTWMAVPDATGTAIPADLRELLDRNPAAHQHFHAFPASKRRMLEWIATAKRPETRQRRIRETVDLAAMNLRANHPGVRAAGR